MKKCFKCNENKDLDQFYLHRDMSDGHLNKCVKCCKKEAIDNNKMKNREDINTYRRKDYRRDPKKYLNWRLKKKYGITIEDLEAMKIKQKGLCAICNKPGNLVVDHDHISNKVRGLLHKQCNAAIGLLGDSPEVIIKAASYVALGGE